MHELLGCSLIEVGNVQSFWLVRSAVWCWWDFSKVIAVREPCFNVILPVCSSSQLLSCHIKYLKVETQLAKYVLLSINHLLKHLITVQSVSFSESKHLYLWKLVQSVQALGWVSSASLLSKAVTECHIFCRECLFPQDLSWKHTCHCDLSGSYQTIILPV